MHAASGPPSGGWTLPLDFCQLTGFTLRVRERGALSREPFVVELDGPQGRMAAYTIHAGDPPVNVESAIGGERFALHAMAKPIPRPVSVSWRDPVLDVEVVLPIERRFQIDTNEGFAFSMTPEHRTSRVFGRLEPRVSGAPYFLEIVHVDDNPFPVVTTLAAVRVPSPQRADDLDREIELEAFHDGLRYALQASFSLPDRH